MARVLVVDDQPDFRHGLVRLLVKAGHVPSEAADGAEALRLLADPNPPVGEPSDRVTYHRANTAS